MQASKIEVGETYALRRLNGIIRFTVEAVVTRRIGKGPANLSSVVEGKIDKNDGGDGSIVKVRPDDVLDGSYQKHAELMEREKREREARDAETRQVREAARKLAHELYARCGLEPPNDVDIQKYHAVFCVEIAKVTINKEGVRLLNKYFERNKLTTEVK